MTDIYVKTPGKLFVAGEYAVVEKGYSAVITAVDTFIHLTIKETEKDYGTVFSKGFTAEPEKWTRPRNRFWLKKHFVLAFNCFLFKYYYLHIGTIPMFYFLLSELKSSEFLLVPGTLWADYHVEVGKIMTDKLLQLGLLDKADVKNEDPDWPAYKKYFMHGTSHHLGLDTHDYGLLWEPMKANMVFTIEPGIYIPEEGFGVRLENDVVTQEHGYPIDLMMNIPIEADEIEELMNA